MTVCIIITAWNQLEKTVACLHTVLAQDYPHFEVLLVDNGSEPTFQPAIRAQFPHVQLIATPRNLGFAGGYNAGVRHALKGEYDFFFLLNNDTLLPPNCLSELVRHLAAHDRVGLVMPTIYYADEPQRLWSVGADFHPWLLELRPAADPHRLEYAPFCAVLLKRELFETVGLLDEQFFLFYEDLDYCRRLLRAGYALHLVPSATLWHAVSTSSGGQNSPLERFWSAQSSGRYFRKHATNGQLWLIVPYRLLSALRTSVRLARQGRWVALRAYWLGLWLGWSTGRSTTPPPAWVWANRAIGSAVTRSEDE